MIEGVLINKLRQIPDERGAIYHMLRRDNEHFIEFGEILRKFEENPTGSLRTYEEIRCIFSLIFPSKS